MRPLRRIPHRCLYCGRRIMGEQVCSLHRGIYESDPLGRTARLPLSEPERLVPPHINDGRTA